MKSSSRPGTERAGQIHQTFSSSKHVRKVNNSSTSHDLYLLHIDIPDSLLEQSKQRGMLFGHSSQLQAGVGVLQVLVFGVRVGVGDSEKGGLWRTM